MLRRSPRAVLLWVGALLLAVATTVTVANGLLSIQHRANELGARHPVLVATRDLVIGTHIGADDVASRVLRGAPVPPGSIGDADALRGRVIVSAVLTGNVVTSRHIARPGRGGVSAAVPDRHRAMRVVLDDVVRPAPGDLVDLYVTFDPQTVSDTAEPTLTVASAVPVLRVDPRSMGTTGRAPVGITVLVSSAQAKRLAFATAAGELALAIAPPDGRDTGASDRR